MTLDTNCPRQRVRVCCAALLLAALAGCTSTRALDDSRALAQTGQHEQALGVLADARVLAPADAALRSAELQQRQHAVTQLVLEAETSRSAARYGTAQALLQRAAAIDPTHPRVIALTQELERMRRREAWLERARGAESTGRLDEAQENLQRVLAEAPGHPGARALQLKLHERRAQVPELPALGAAFRKPLTLEFRDAPLRSVLEGLGRTHGINFVFDREVRVDVKVSILLRDVTLADALRVVLTTQQLASKVLNESTLLIYPNTQAKQREHQDLVTRSFFLANADAKQAQALVRTMAKTRDLFVDERLNLIVVRDTPEVVRVVERLLASIDVPEPEVLLEVEVIEIATNRLDEVGLQWPEQVSYGLPGALGQVQIGERGNFRASIANPALLATLRETTSRANTLANPRLRARNREKAKVMIGEKLPVFTTTSTANVGVSTSVSYLDVGLKLEVEPNVQLDNDVVMKVHLDVSTLIGRVLGPQGSVAYQVGSRQASTSLRLRDGETQVLAGLIREEDSKAVAGVPGLSAMPVVGRLFGLHTDQRIKTEIVLLITPRVIRSLAIPDAAVGPAAAGVDASPGTAPLRLAPGAAVTVPPATGGRAPSSVARAPTAAAQAAEERVATVMLSTSGQTDPGATAAITLHNLSDATVQGELAFDAGLLQQAQAGASGSGPVPFALPPGGERVFLLRVLPAAAGQTLTVTVAGIVATNPAGDAVAVQVQGDGTLVVRKP